MIERQTNITIIPEHVADIPIQELEKAIGYLTTWAWARYHKVSISSRKNELFVVYDDPDRFIMGAIWRGDEFTYHS